jgi:hypothetical protein
MGSRGFLAVKEGIFAWAHALGRENGPGDSGGYFFQRGKVYKVINGLLHNAIVSLDGCKVAFVHDPYTTPVLKDREDRITVKFIDVCVGVH